MIASGKRRLATVFTTPVLAIGSFVALAISTPTPAQACGTIPINKAENVWLGPAPSVNVATLQLWYNGCDPNNRFTYATMSWDQNPSTSTNFTLKVWVEDELEHVPFAAGEADGYVDQYADCTRNCQAISHGVNIDAYGAPKSFRALASAQIGSGCLTTIATDWWQFSYGRNIGGGIQGYSC
ncbi:hypothetical protein NE236_10305 [Actinoallomurus purpureus]|uniref:hypothetical protein n=1 Tax=Actinoallomurus purpureus TaxID=478114 RepID=UPI00209290D2|nr:hypothetical protein [Actinoallomurus purpureus]MCO6005377.1 hypothetical protein [Actinoallomurus purpureus]